MQARGAGVSTTRLRLPNPKLYIEDLSGARALTLYLTRDFASLELQLGIKTLCTQILINMNADINARPYMAGILENDNFLRKAFYLGKVFDENVIELLADGTLSLHSINQLGHDFTLEVSGKNNSGQNPWCTTQSSNYRDEREIFFQCNSEGQVFISKEKPLPSLWFCATDSASGSKYDDDSLQKLRGKKLERIHFDINPVRLFFVEPNNIAGEVLELRLLNDADFTGDLLLKKEALQDQYRHCESSVEVCMYAQFLNKNVNQVSLKENGDLTLDFENNTTLIAKGDPPKHECLMEHWELLDARTNNQLTAYWP